MGTDASLPVGMRGSGVVFAAAIHSPWCKWNGWEIKEKEVKKGVAR